MNFNPESLARVSSRRPWTVIGSWLVLLIVAIGLTGAFLADKQTFVVPRGGAEVVEVTFTAMAEGLVESQLRIESEDPGDASNRPALAALQIVDSSLEFEPDHVATLPAGAGASIGPLLGRTRRQRVDRCVQQHTGAVVVAPCDGGDGVGLVIVDRLHPG